MKKDLKEYLRIPHKNMSSILVEVSVLEELIHSYFFYKSSINKDGGLRDAQMKSTLDFQYHSAYFILAASLLSYITNEDEYELDAERVLNYLIKLGVEINKKVNAFLCVGLCLSYFFIRNSKLAKKIEEYVSLIEIYPDVTNNKRRANNFYALKALALELRSLITGSHKDSSEAEVILNRYLVNWQDEDGFFYDKPFETNSNSGVIHLTYHSTMWMIISFFALIHNEENLKAKSVKAYKALSAVTSPTGLYTYGRSNNAIFGDSCALLACAVQALFTNGQYGELEFRELMLEKILSSKSRDGHFLINGNTHDGSRMGFDKYMFVSVYGLWALALTTLSQVVIEKHITE